MAPCTSVFPSTRTAPIFQVLTSINDDSTNDYRTTDHGLRTSVHPRFQQSQRKQHLRVGALKHVEPSRPSVEDQPFAEQRVKENQERRENDLPPHPIRQPHLRFSSFDLPTPISCVEQVFRFQPCISILLSQPAIQRLAIVVVDDRAQRQDSSLDLHPMAVPFIAIV